MNKQEFLNALQAGLSGLPQDDIEERLAFYSEMIDDRMEEGMTEEEAVAQAGPIEEIVMQTVDEIPLPKIVKERIRPKRRKSAGEIILLILGFPLWFPLLIAFAAVIFSLYIVIWSLLISLWAVEISLWAGALGGVAAFVICLVRGDTLTGLAFLAAGLVCAGLSVFLFLGCVEASKGVIRLTKTIARWIKTLFIKKENEQ